MGHGHRIEIALRAGLRRVEVGAAVQVEQGHVVVLARRSGDHADGDRPVTAQHERGLPGGDKPATASAVSAATGAPDPVPTVRMVEAGR